MDTSHVQVAFIINDANGKRVHDATLNYYGMGEQKTVLVEAGLIDALKGLNQSAQQELGMTKR